MRVTIVQTSLVWEQPAANLAHLAQLMLPLADQTDLVVLPEMFATGFSMKAQALAVEMSGEEVMWMKGQSKQLNAAMVGSLMIAEGGAFYNRLIWVTPDGRIQTYNKRHLFSYAGEDEYFAAGTERILIEWKGFRICPFVCYDLRFPVWSRNTEAYDLAIYVANWPAVRSDAWKTLLKARAIENQCFVAGVNIIGQDGNGIAYSGDSTILSFDGNLLIEAKSESGFYTTELAIDALSAFRTRFRFLDDMDRFTIDATIS